MRTLTIAFVALFGAGSTVAAQSPAQIRVGAPTRVKAPPGSATAGSTWIEFPVHVTNTSKRSIWLDGHSLGSPFYSLFTRQNDSSRWTDRGMGFCGTGAGAHELAPGAVTTFTVAVPERYVGEQLRVELSVRASPEDSTTVTVSSDATSIK
jgi:hypothetical protein